VGKPEGKRPLGRPRLRWEDNIKMDLQEVGGGRGHWMELAQLPMTIWRMRITCSKPKATNTLRICNTYCFSTATMVGGTLRNVHVIQTVPVLLQTKTVSTYSELSTGKVYYIVR
jgi:hypothetical protein